MPGEHVLFESHPSTAKPEMLTSGGRSVLTRRRSRRTEVLLLLEVVGGLGGVALHVVGDFVLGVDGLDRALGFAGAAIDALFGVDHEVVAGVVDAIDRADLDATLVLGADARLRDHIGQRASSLNLVPALYQPAPTPNTRR